VATTGVQGGRGSRERGTSPVGVGPRLPSQENQPGRKRDSQFKNDSDPNTLIYLAGLHTLLCQTPVEQWLSQLQGATRYPAHFRLS